MNEMQQDVFQLLLKKNEDELYLKEVEAVRKRNFTFILFFLFFSVAGVVILLCCELSSELFYFISFVSCMFLIAAGWSFTRYKNEKSQLTMQWIKNRTSSL